MDLFVLGVDLAVLAWRGDPGRQPAQPGGDLWAVDVVSQVGGADASLQVRSVNR